MPAGLSAPVGFPECHTADITLNRDSFSLLPLLCDVQVIWNSTQQRVRRRNQSNDMAILLDFNVYFHGTHVMVNALLWSALIEHLLLILFWIEYEGRRHCACLGHMRKRRCVVILWAHQQLG